MKDICWNCRGSDESLVSHNSGNIYCGKCGALIDTLKEDPELGIGAITETEED
jgi:hypothetical protein